MLPDNCLFADQAGEVFEILTQDCRLHTVLRLPRGTFTPYSQGVKANVVFFTRDGPTKEREMSDHRGGQFAGGVYGLGFIGALVYFLQSATSFWDGVYGVFQAFVWPAYLVWGLLHSLKM